MKKAFYIVAAVLLLSCAKEAETSISVAEETYRLEAVISTPEEKTYLGEKEGTVYPNYWGAGDAVSVNGIASEALASDSEYVGTAKATFTLNGVINKPYYYAYPAAAVSGYSAGRATITLPKVQEWSADSYDPAAFIMLGSSSSLPLVLTPVVSVIKLTIPGSYSARIASVMFESLGSQKVSGPFSTDFSSLTAGSGAASRVNLFAPAAGVDFETSVFIVIPAQTYSGGMRFTVRATDGTQMTYSTSSTFAAEAGKVYPLTTKTYSPDPETIPDGMLVMSSNVRYATARDKESDPDTGDRDWTNRKAAWCQMLNSYRPAVVGLQEAQKEQVKDIKSGCSGYNHYGVGRLRGYDIVSDGSGIFGTGNTYAKEESSTILYRTDLITLNSSGTIWHSANPTSTGSYFTEMEDEVPQTSTWAILTYKPTGTRFFLLNTHPSVYGAAHSKEIALIKSTITSKNTGNLPVILTGDWNMTEDDDNMAPIVGNYYSARQTAPRRDFYETYHWWGTRAKIIDHIFYGGSVNCLWYQTDRRKWNNLYISDHYPVFSVFDFNASAMPLADFDLPASVAAGTEAVFTDRSSSAAGIATWSWDIDGIISTEKNPHVTFQSMKYNVPVKLTVADRDGNSASIIKLLTVSKIDETATHEGYSNSDLFY